MLFSSIIDEEILKGFGVFNEKRLGKLLRQQISCQIYEISQKLMKNC